MQLKSCLLKPVAEIYYAACLLQTAVSFHLDGNEDIAATCIKKANMPAIREWTEALWGGFNPEIHTLNKAASSLPVLKKEDRIPQRMPTKSEQESIIQRDGYNCRFCRIPVVSPVIRKKLNKLYPDSAVWGRKNIEQHAALQAMWLQFDHLLPHSRGGTNELDNIVITCAPCNFSRMQYTLEELYLVNPLTLPFEKSSWDGLNRL